MTLPLGLNASEVELAASVDFCRREMLGIEVTAFAFPQQLDHDLDERIARHAAAVVDLPWISLHGPFLDLYPASPDPSIVEVCRRRHRSGLHAASRIGASLYVAHLNSVPLIRNVGYLTRFVNATADFWLPLADEAGSTGMTIVLEKLWEEDSSLQQEVVTQANHPNLKASFDSGHCLMRSQKAAATWIEELGEHLAHCHLHDNDGFLRSALAHRRGHRRLAGRVERPGAIRPGRLRHPRKRQPGSQSKKPGCAPGILVVGILMAVF
jgi:sugar phosphate isomerase/epimerase